MTEFMVTATWMVEAEDVEEAVLSATELLDNGGAAASGDWSVFDPDGTEYEIEWNEPELRDPDDETPTGVNPFEGEDYSEWTDAELAEYGLERREPLPGTEVEVSMDG